MRSGSSNIAAFSFFLCVAVQIIGGGVFGVARGQTIQEFERDIAAKEAEIKRLEQEAAEYRKTLNRASLQARTLHGELARIDAAIRQTSYQLSLTRAELEATVLRLKAVSARILETESDIARRKSQMVHTLREIAYVDDMGLLAVLLSAPSISDFFDNAVQLSNLEQRMQHDLLAMQLLKGDLEANKTREEDLQESQRTKQQNLSAQQAILEMKKRERTALLRQTRNQEQLYQQLLKENQKRQSEILREIEELESELRKLLLRVTVPSRQPGLFSWPIDNAYVTQEYGDTKSTGFINDFYTFHNGIDFGAESGVGTPVKAVADGVVVASGDLSPYAYGRWLAVDHRNGLTTLYAHLSRIDAAKGKEVRQGSVIGYMGSTGYATGPHLHLTVYATETFKVVQRSYGLLPLGASINPRDYLPR